MIDLDLIGVMAMDPGRTTGYAWGNIEDGLMTITTGQAVWSVSDLFNQLNKTTPDIIIYEDFEYRNRARAGLELISKELIGIINLYTDQHPEVEVFKQKPSYAINQYFNKQRLKKDNLWKPNHIHANEACMHLLQWYVFGAGYVYNKKGYKPHEIFKLDNLPSM